MKVIYELFVYSLFSLLMLSACSDADDVVADGALAGDNISPVSSFSVETTNADNELLVKWVNPINCDLDMVEISYRDVSEELTRASFHRVALLSLRKAGRRVSICLPFLTSPFMRCRQ